MSAALNQIKQRLYENSQEVALQLEADKIKDFWEYDTDTNSYISPQIIYYQSSILRITDTIAYRPDQKTIHHSMYVRLTIDDHYYYSGTNHIYSLNSYSSYNEEAISRHCEVLTNQISDMVLDALAQAIIYSRCNITAELTIYKEDNA